MTPDKKHIGPTSAPTEGATVTIAVREGWRFERVQINGGISFVRGVRDPKRDLKATAREIMRQHKLTESAAQGMRTDYAQIAANETEERIVTALVEASADGYVCGRQASVQDITSEYFRGMLCGATAAIAITLGLLSLLSR